MNGIIEGSADRELLRLLLGAVVDEMTDAACRRTLGAMRATAQRELERAHRFDGQLTIADAH